MTKSYSHRQFGALGEKLAADYLKKSKYKILEKNYKTKLGEIDIIAQKDDTIVFVEVKSRSADPFLRGQYAVDKRKQFHIMRTAAYYLDKRNRPSSRVLISSRSRSTATRKARQHQPSESGILPDGILREILKHHRVNRTYVSRETKTAGSRRRFCLISVFFSCYLLVLVL